MTAWPDHPGVKLSGAPNLDEVKKTPGYPAQKYWKKGSLAFIECVEEIPCNPCESSCPQGAICVGTPITNLPVLDAEKCIGCGKCIAACPGLAIYIKNYTYAENEATVTFPYEYWPIPSRGQEVSLVDEMGDVVCQGKVLRVVNTKQNNHTPLVTCSFSKEFFERVKSMKRLPKRNN